MQISSILYPCKNKNQSYGKIEAKTSPYLRTIYLSISRNLRRILASIRHTFLAYLFYQMCSPYNKRYPSISIRVSRSAISGEHSPGRFLFAIRAYQIREGRSPRPGYFRPVFRRSRLSPANNVHAGETARIVDKVFIEWFSRRPLEGNGMFGGRIFESWLGSVSSTIGVDGIRNPRAL